MKFQRFPRFDEADAVAAARELRALPDTRSTDRATRKRQQETIRALQERMGGLVVDGYDGPQTRRRVAQLLDG